MTGNIKDDFEAAKPGWMLEVVSYRAAAKSDHASDHSDMVGPNQSELKKKYLPHGSKGTGGSDPEAAEPAADQDAWAKIRDKDDPDSPVGPKTVLYDKKSNRPKAIQG